MSNNSQAELEILSYIESHLGLSGIESSQIIDDLNYDKDNVYFHLNNFRENNLIKGGPEVVKEFHGDIHVYDSPIIDITQSGKEYLKDLNN